MSEIFEIACIAAIVLGVLLLLVVGAVLAYVFIASGVEAVKTTRIRAELKRAHLWEEIKQVEQWDGVDVE